MALPHERGPTMSLLGMQHLPTGTKLRTTTLIAYRD